MTKERKILTLFILTSSTLLFNLPFLSAIFYNPFKDAFGYTHEQLGTLLSVYGIVATFGYFFGGWVADKYSTKLLIITALLSTGVLGIYTATLPSYHILLIVYILYGFTTVLLYYPALIKSIRMLGTDSEQGKLFGWFEGFGGVINAFISFLSLFLFSSVLVEQGSFRWVIVTYSSFCILIAFLIFIFFREHKIDSEDSINIKLIPKALKLPVTWLNAFIILGIYINMTGSAYLNPYLVDVFGVSVVFSTALIILNKYIFKTAVCPIGGMLRDKFGRSTKVYYIGLFVIVISLLIILFLPTKSSLAVIAVILSLVYTLFIAFVRGCLYVPISEAKVPLEMTGTVIGIVSCIGYCSDIFLYRICGGWLDTYGNKGYTYIFLFLLFGSAMSLVSTFLFDLYLTKIRSNSLTENSN